MKNMLRITSAAAVLSMMAAAAAAQPMTATVTADNHYALYTGTVTTMAFIGGNEAGAGGSPGTYNWSLPEFWEFQGDSTIYIAAWSDDSVAQGLLAQISSPTDTFHSGDARWQVFPTFVNRGDGDAAPTAAEIALAVTVADAGNLWQTPYVGPANGASPWGTVPGIGGEPRWMWLNIPGDADPLDGGSGHGELLVFRMQIPTPGAAAMVGLGGVAWMRRSRRR